MTTSGAGSRRFSRRWLGAGALVLAALRAASVIWSAASNTRGDFFASLPGTYVRTLNPALWNSDDLSGAMGFHLDTYYHGPIQYLTLYPIAFLNSYAAIAQLLWVLYVPVIAAGCWCLWRAVRILAPDRPTGVPLATSALLFFPLLQCYVQREFEVVTFAALALALWLLLADRKNAAAVVLAYVAWFKYIPLLFAGYLGLRRWPKAVGAFALTSLAILALAQIAFGLPEFFNNNVPGHAAQVAQIWSFSFGTDAAGERYGLGFCQGWFESESTLANIRHGLCSVSSTEQWFPAHVVYVLICVAVAAAYLITHYRLSTRRLETSEESWRRSIEFSIVVTVCSCFFFAHYYYLIALLIPLNILLARYQSAGQRGNLALWGVSYTLISAFVIPITLLSRLTGVDVWAWYIQGHWFLYGELLLVFLLLREYWDLGLVREPRAIEAAA